MNEDDGRPGVKTKPGDKKILSMAFKERLYNKNVLFHEDFFTNTDKISTEEMKDEFAEQLANFSRRIKPSNDVHKPPTEHFGGKMGHGFDDLVMAAMINNVMYHRFYSVEHRDRYGKYIKL
jgi:hypothetical protein